MPSVAAKVLAEALELPEGEREQLTRDLIASLDGPPDDPADVARAWLDEINQTLVALDNGTMRTVPFEQAMDEIRAELKARREARAR